MPRPKKINPKEIASKNPIRKSQISGRLLGMKDILPAEYRYFKIVSDRAQELAEYFGFNYIKTPLLENYDLYKKSSRRNLEKEVYWVEGEKAEKIIMRPEITQGIVRAYLENINQFTLPSKLFSLGPVFRQEKLQSGRYRESTQFDLEIIGDAKPMAEVGLIALVNNFFKELKINVQVQINSLGSRRLPKRI
ncbi:MAG: ATP phosphoribosyltransferase regulatory subunit [Candidatus Falkowbacteria bacterium]|nr:ATP phosphoribosyltransferase regulatory subunit [Candidatus Falkowbacteria bacterium]